MSNRNNLGVAGRRATNKLPVRKRNLRLGQKCNLRKRDIFDGF